MKSVLFAALLAASLQSPAVQAHEMASRAAETPVAPAASFRAPDLAPFDRLALEAPLEKSVGAVEERPGGRLRVATVRAAAKSAPVEGWTAAAGGHVARLEASSAEALGLRVKLELGTIAHPIEVRVQGGDGRIEAMTVEPARAGEVWTPWTEGSSQLVELFSRERPAPGEVRIGAVLHFTASPFAKAAGACTVPTLCTTNDAALDAAIAQRKKSVIRIGFVDGGSGFVCSATLVNTEKFPAPYVLTANHCVDDGPTAATVTSYWFYENTGCDPLSPVNPAFVQRAGGAQLVFGNYNVDQSLLLMNDAPPAGALYSGWNAGRVSATGAPVVSLSHPAGDTSRLALGATDQDFRIVGRPQDMYGVRFSRGIIQGGSSGSGLFTMSGGSLQLRGVLSGTTIRQPGGMSCTNLNEDALYGRLEVFAPQIDQYIRNVAQPADDAPNRYSDVPILPDVPLDMKPNREMALTARRIDYAGDLDVFKFTLNLPAYVSAWTAGANLDTVGSILDSRGVALEANDDAQVDDNHFGITRRLDPGTYYVQVGHFDAAGTGAYDLRLRAETVDVNYTALWWNALEPGWGLNINHQGETLFATLFTYELDGTPLWLVMSSGTRQPDGTYEGTLFRATGSAFNAAWSASNVRPVGTMRIGFNGASNATLTYSYAGAQVVKSISRQEFSTLPSCAWSAFDRSFADNYQDLWWNPAEPGWGLNIAHQGDTLFATLFTYDASGRGLWLVMSNGAKTGTRGYSGALYRTTGPAFNASPWTPAAPAQAGTMSLTFAHGNQATLTYSVNGVQVTKLIQRQVFSTPKTQCE